MKNNEVAYFFKDFFSGNFEINVFDIRQSGLDVIKYILGLDRCRRLFCLCDLYVLIGEGFQNKILYHLMQLFT